MQSNNHFRRGPVPESTTGGTVLDVSPGSDRYSGVMSSTTDLPGFISAAETEPSQVRSVDSATPPATNSARSSVYLFPPEDDYFRNTQAGASSVEQRGSDLWDPRSNAGTSSPNTGPLMMSEHRVSPTHMFNGSHGQGSHDLTAATFSPQKDLERRMRDNNVGFPEFVEDSSVLDNLTAEGRRFKQWAAGKLWTLGTKLRGEGSDKDNRS